MAWISIRRIEAFREASTAAGIGMGHADYPVVRTWIDVSWMDVEDGRRRTQGGFQIFGMQRMDGPEPSPHGGQPPNPHCAWSHPPDPGSCLTREPREGLQCKVLLARYARGKNQIRRDERCDVSKND